MSWKESNIPDQTGRIAVVTGANGGLGLESTRALAAKGAHVVMAARNQEKAKAAHAGLLAAQPDASLEIVELDLASLDSVRRASDEIAAKHPRIDLLLNNAGLMAMPERRTADGFEMQLGVNHLGHWVFTAGLLRPLLAADAARIVTVTSVARFMGLPVNPRNVNMEGRYEPWMAYGRAKLANYHFAIGLQRELARRGLPAASLSAHPGLSNTDLQTHSVDEGGAGPLGPFFQHMAAWTGMSPAKGALPQLRAATDPRARGGELYGPRYGNSGPPVRRPILRRIGLDRAIATLWEVSRRETGVELDLDTARAAR